MFLVLLHIMLGVGVCVCQECSLSGAFLRVLFAASSLEG